MINRILKISFWGIIFWFPLAFILLGLTASGIINTEKSVIIGDIAAITIGTFSVSLWMFSIVSLFFNWSKRTLRTNILYFVLIFIGSIIGSMIFYILDKRTT